MTRIRKPRGGFYHETYKGRALDWPDLLTRSLRLYFFFHPRGIANAAEGSSNFILSRALPGLFLDVKVRKIVSLMLHN